MAQTIDTAVTRTDAPRKVTGAAMFAGDEIPAGMLYGALTTSDIARGTLSSLDTARAEAEPGVVAVYTHETLDDYRKLKGFYSGGPGMTSFWPMRGTEIKYAGQPVAVVVAETAAAARRGAQLVEATYDAAEPRIEMDPGESSVVTGPDGSAMVTDVGDFDAGFAEGDASVEAEYSTPYQHHNPMEMFSATAEWRRDRLTVWMPSQSVRILRTGIAKAFDMPETSVRVVSPFVGGAFGSKAGLTTYTMLTIAAARAVGAPLRLLVSRSQMYTVATYRPASVQRVRLAAAADGRLTAYSHVQIGQTPRFEDVVNPGTEITAAMYACPNIHLEERLSRTDTNSGGFMRAPAEMQTFFALEQAMDELAVELEMDPVALRRVNEPGRHPVKDVPYSSRALLESYDAVSRSFGWADRSAAPGSMTDGDWLVGYGCATATYPTHISPSSARVRMHGSGHALIELAAHDVGTGSYTIFAQIAAARLGLPVAACDVLMGEGSFPFAPVSGGSTTAASAGSAVHVACMNLAADVARQVSALPEGPFAGVDASTITLEDGVLRGPDRARSSSR